jgi:hypothetical protein
MSTVRVDYCGTFGHASVATPRVVTCQTSHLFCTVYSVGRKPVQSLYAAKRRAFAAMPIPVGATSPW